MLCVTGNEATLERLQRRLLRVTALTDRGGTLEGRLLQEVRLDALTEPLENAFGLLARYSPHLVVCCRPTREGGAFSGSESERQALLERAARLGVAYVDIEADCSEAEVERIGAAALASRASKGHSRLILSWHDFEGGRSDLARRLAAIASRPADVIKVALAVDDAVGLRPLYELARGVDRPMVLIGMGFAGLLSRCRYPAFGSPWTYVKADDAVETAPGQLSLDEARAMALPEAARRPFAALAGGPQIAHSPGPVVYNRFFRARSRPWSYLPVCSQSEEIFDFLRELGAMGISVTMPLKDAALEYAGGQVDDSARQAKAVNSLRFEDGQAAAINTDIAGVAIPLRQALDALAEPVRDDAPDARRPRRALILGAGGAARAAALACRSLGLRVTASARRLERARKLASLVDAAAPWDKRQTVEAEVLINATPLAGAAGCPWPEHTPLDKAIVFDLAISGEPSLLLERARAEGASVISAQQMWLAQGAQQIGWISGEEVTPEELREYAPDETPPPPSPAGERG